MLCRQVPHPRHVLEPAAQQFKLLHLFALLVLLLQLPHCSSAIKLFHEHEHEPVYSQFIAYDGNLPAKFFHPESELQSVDLERNHRVQRYAGADSGQDRFAEMDFSTEKAEEDGGQLDRESSAEQGEAAQVVLPRRERRLNWNRWLSWFKPIDRSSIGFVPVRGRKTTFFAARGKKAIPSVQEQLPLTASKPQTRYYLVALTIKPIPKDALQ